MIDHRKIKTKKASKALYPVGGYTKRIDQYGAVPAAVLAEERRLQRLEGHIEKGRRWQLAHCEREERKAARHLQELNEAKGRAWLPAVSHTEYLYGGCLAVRVVDREDDKDKEENDIRLQPRSTSCHRTQAKTDLPKLLLPDQRPTKGTPRTPRSWATLKKQFSQGMLPRGRRLGSTQDALGTASCLVDRAGGLEGGCSGGDGASVRSKGQGGDFVHEMKRCRYLRVPVWYQSCGNDGDSNHSCHHN
ncbi:uncharacterized protein LOC110988914 [Acanthaster planci]|uniref:Uncharacterized protein LOC110988914 n=1 Tax=Acanthaster planci TaxID=133434 RepID=A0A8B7ZUV8_ACAPL|nr:uncharacterized protein LOC110988914 [Acanthaster planci]